MKYPFNLVIHTPREYFWHIKHLCTLISSWVTNGYSFWQDFYNTDFYSFLPYEIKMKFRNCSNEFSWILIDHENHHENDESEPCRPRRAFLGNSFVCRRVRQGRNSVLQKDCQKLVPSITYEPLKVPLCFICQKNSRGVRITWLKGYFIVTTFEDARAWQSWGGNFRTPCRKILT